MKTIQGPGIFLAQFAGDSAPFNTLDGMAGWAAGLGFKGIQTRAGTGGCSIWSGRQRARLIATRCGALLRATVSPSPSFPRICKAS